MKNLLIVVLLVLAGCSTPDYSEHLVYAPPVVTGWKDANGKIHLKGEHDGAGFAVISVPRQYPKTLGWGGASR